MYHELTLSLATFGDFSDDSDQTLVLLPGVMGEYWLACG
jgi:hypothetical protein